MQSQQLLATAAVITNEILLLSDSHIVLPGLYYIINISYPSTLTYPNNSYTITFCFQLISNIVICQSLQPLSESGSRGTLFLVSNMRSWVLPVYANWQIAISTDNDHRAVYNDLL